MWARRKGRKGGGGSRPKITQKGVVGPGRGREEKEGHVPSSSINNGKQIDVGRVTVVRE